MPYVIAVYDVDSSRVTKMMKLCRRFLKHVQDSVFEGELTAKQVQMLKHEALRKMKVDEDSFIIFQIRDRSLVDREQVGTERAELGFIL